MLRRFWFEFERSPQLSFLNIGCGVTAFNQEDAIDILMENLFKNETMPKIIKCTPDIDIRKLDQGHVIPNMGVVIDRGIWFPLGYKA